MTMLTLNQTLLTITLENAKVGTQMAAGCIDDDGTARVELVERLEVGWRNLTTKEQATSIDLAQKFDDLVVTQLPTAKHEDQTISVPRPHVPHGPRDVPAHVADARYLREAAHHIRDGYAVGGYNLTSTVIRLLLDAAEALESTDG